MSDEKRNLRLLSFRKRRDEATKAAGDAPCTEFEDGELRGLLGAWQTPAPSHLTRTRLLSEFRSQAAPVPLWRRLFTASLPVPAPVAAMVVLALVLTAAALAARPPVITLEAQHAAAAAAAPIQVVEVPVPQEKIVTRIVYVDRGGKRTPREVERVEPSRLANVEKTHAQREGVAKGDERNAAGYFTRVDMAEFQPSAEMKIRIVGKGENR